MGNYVSNFVKNQSSILVRACIVLGLKAKPGLVLLLLHNKLTNCWREFLPLFHILSFEVPNSRKFIKNSDDLGQIWSLCRNFSHGHRLRG